MNARFHPSLRKRLLAGVAVVVAIGFALPVWAAQLVTVRAGAHEKYTRVVFELDASSGYRIEKVGTKSAPALRVTLDADSRIQDIRGHGDVRGVKVSSAGSRAVATIQLRRSDLRVQEMILSNPHRIVLDLYRPDSAVVKAPAPKPTAKPVTKTEPEAAPKPVARTEPPVAPKPVAKTTPKPEPKEVAKTEPAAPPKTAVAPEPAPKPLARTTPAPAPAITPAPKQVAREESDASPLPTPEPVQDEKPGDLADANAPGDRTVPAMKITPPKPAKTETAKAPAPAPPPASAGWMDRVLSDPMWQGGIAAGVVALFAVVFLTRRRYRALPNDLDVTAIAEEVEAADRHPEDGFAMDDLPADSVTTSTGSSKPAATRDESESTFADLFDEPSETRATAAPEPVAPMPDFQPATASEATVTSDTDSLFDDTGGLVGDEEASEGEAPMDQDMDLPTDPSASAPPPVMGGAAAPQADVSSMLQEFERRMAAMEAKLDDANEAREKLERQVAAQSEELRVQRAAIARTQRALRTMSRADEDKATEPALRDGDTQAKTRVNV